MLKNVATLMLATEVSAETDAAKAARVARAWAQDQEKEDQRTEWIATESGACTDEGSDEIRGLTTAVSEALNTRDADAQAVTDLTDDGGAWQVADAARTQAVQAAIDAEGASGAGSALDDLDAAAEAERAAAQTFREKYQAFQKLTLAATAATNAESTISGRRAGLETAVSNALTAYTEANTRKTGETQALGALYCMLGGSTAADVAANSLPLNANNWWDLAAMQSNGGGFPDGFDETGSDAPVYCTVPAITDADSNEVKPAVVYWTKDGDSENAGTDGTGHLAAEAADGTAKWTLALQLANVQAAENDRAWCVTAPLNSYGDACTDAEL